MLTCAHYGSKSHHLPFEIRIKGQGIAELSRNSLIEEKRMGNRIHYNMNICNCYINYATPVPLLAVVAWSWDGTYFHVRH